MIGKFLAHSAIYTLGALLSRGISFLLLPLYTYNLSPRDFAVVDYLTVVGAFVAVMLALEFAQGITRFVPELLHDYPALRRMASTGFLFTLLVHVLLLALVTEYRSELAALLFDDTSARIVEALPWAAAAWLSVGLVTYWRNLLRAELRPKSSTAVAIVHAAFVLGLTCLLLLDGEATPVQAMQALCGGGAIAALFGMRLCRPSIGLIFDNDSFRQLAAFSAPLVLSSVGVIAAQFIDRIMIVELLGVDALAPYALAGRIALIVSLLMVGFQNALTPLVYAGLKDPALKGQVATLLRWFTALALLGIAGLIIIDRWLISLIAPGGYDHAVSLTPLLVAAVVIAGAYIFFPGLTVAKRTLQLAILNLGAAGLNLGLNLLLIPHYGLNGAAMATLISAIVGLVAVAIAGQKHFAVPAGFWRLTGTVSIVLALLLAVSRLELGPVAEIGAGVAALIVVLVTVVATGLIGRDELVELKSRLLR